MNNFEKIKQMTLEQLAEVFAWEVTQPSGLGFSSAFSSYVEWLNQEVEDERN